MTPQAQAAFVKAYGKNVAHLPDVYVADFVARYEANMDIEYSFEEASIMDALCMWHDAVKFAKEKS